MLAAPNSGDATGLAAGIALGACVMIGKRRPLAGGRAGWMTG